MYLPSRADFTLFRSMTHLENRLRLGAIDGLSFRNAVMFLQSHIATLTVEVPADVEALIRKGRAIKDKVAKGEPLLSERPLEVGKTQFTKKEDPEKDARIAKKWRDRVEDHGRNGGTIKFDLSRAYESSSLRDLLTAGFIPAINREKPARTDPTKLVCTFCGVEVLHHEATFGRGEPQISVRRDLVEVPNGWEIRKQVLARSNKQVACRSCCLNIRKPIIISREDI